MAWACLKYLQDHLEEMAMAQQDERNKGDEMYDLDELNELFRLCECSYPQLKLESM